MKKKILVFAICFSVSFIITSCKKEKKEEISTEEIITEDFEEVEIIKEEVTEAQEVETKEMASNILYQCPMDCEKGKSYSEEGSCPVCKMNLTPKEVDMNSEVNQNDNEEAQDNKVGRIAKDAKVESTPNN